MRRAAISVAEGMIILRQFSTGPDESNSRMSWVPVPMSMARMRMVDLCGTQRPLQIL